MKRSDKTVLGTEFRRYVNSRVLVHLRHLHLELLRHDQASLDEVVARRSERFVKTRKDEGQVKCGNKQETAETAGQHRITTATFFTYRRSQLSPAGNIHSLSAIVTGFISLLTGLCSPSTARFALL